MLKRLVANAAQAGAEGDYSQAAIHTAAIFEALRIYWTRAYRRARGSDAPSFEAILPARISVSAAAVFSRSPTLWQEPKLAEDKHGEVAIQALGFALGEMAALRRVVEAVEDAGRRRNTDGDDDQTPLCEEDLALAVYSLARRVADLEQREGRLMHEFAQICEQGLDIEKAPEMP